MWKAAKELQSLRHMVITFNCPRGTSNEETILETARRGLCEASATATRTLEVRWVQIREGLDRAPDGMSDEYRIERETFGRP